MIPKRLQQILYQPALSYKANRLGPEILTHAPPKTHTFLDLGCGDCTITDYIARRLPDTAVLPLDVVNTSLTSINPVLYDGHRIPFPDSYFDVALASLILHHCPSPEDIFAELIRVSRRIIIIEEIYTNSWDLRITKFNDFVTNRMESARVSLPFTFKTDLEWRAVFARYNLKLTAAHRVFQIPLGLTKQMLYCLEKKSHMSRTKTERKNAERAIG